MFEELCEKGSECSSQTICKGYCSRFVQTLKTLIVSEMKGAMQIIGHRKKSKLVVEIKIDEKRKRYMYRTLRGNIWKWEYWNREKTSQ